MQVKSYRVVSNCPPDWLADSLNSRGPLYQSSFEGMLQFRVELSMQSKGYGCILHSISDSSGDFFQQQK